MLHESHPSFQNIRGKYRHPAGTRTAKQTVQHEEYEEDRLEMFAEDLLVCLYDRFKKKLNKRNGCYEEVEYYE